MADHRVAEKDVVFLPAVADVVDDQWCAVWGSAFGNNADMEQTAAAQLPCGDIARCVADGIDSGRARPTFAFEPAHLVGHAATVDAAVLSSQAPLLRIFREMHTHVLVDGLLQGHALVTQCAHDDVGAYAASAGAAQPG